MECECSFSMVRNIAAWSLIHHVQNVKDSQTLFVSRCRISVMAKVIQKWEIQTIKVFNINSHSIFGAKSLYFGAASHDECPKLFNISPSGGDVFQRGWRLNKRNPLAAPCKETVIFIFFTMNYLYISCLSLHSASHSVLPLLLLMPLLSHTTPTLPLLTSLSNFTFVNPCLILFKGESTRIALSSPVLILHYQLSYYAQESLKHLGEEPQGS